MIISGRQISLIEQRPVYINSYQKIAPTWIG
jgi:hypothetical protein